MAWREGQWGDGGWLEQEMTVDTVWKGPVPERIYIATHESEPFCGARLSGPMVLFSGGYEDDGRLWIGLCNSWPASDSMWRFNVLGPGMDPDPSLIAPDSVYLPAVSKTATPIPTLEPTSTPTSVPTPTPTPKPTVTTQPAPTASPTLNSPPVYEPPNAARSFPAHALVILVVLGAGCVAMVLVSHRMVRR